IEGFEHFALKLIAVGADTTLKMRIKNTLKSEIHYRPGFFSRPIKPLTEHSTLELAEYYKRPKIAHELRKQLKRKLVEDYIEQRQQEAQYLSHLSLGGINLSFGWFNKQQKLRAARDLLSAIKNDETSYHTLNLKHFGAIYQGRLGVI